VHEYLQMKNIKYIFPLYF